jgi:uncharacterized membrane protein
MFNVLLFNVVVLFVRLILEYCDLFSTMYVIYECKYISISSISHDGFHRIPVVRDYGQCSSGLNVEDSCLLLRTSESVKFFCVSLYFSMCVNVVTMNHDINEIVCINYRGLRKENLDCYIDSQNEPQYV